jgi:S-disulfanyl-L-cysteine oxidoreductase SoxD
MSMRKFAVGAGVAALALGASMALGALALAESPKLGKPITQADLAEWDINILPDGTNLPAGSGKAADGAKIFAQKCVACHGENGQGGSAVRLIGGPPKATLDGGKTIANYWPYATTVFDFIRRSMPFTQPRSLTDQEVYALTAYLLASNKLIGEGDEMNATTLPKVAMPNRGNFVIRFPDRI